MTSVDAAIERRGWTVADAHESALTIRLEPAAAAILSAGPSDVLVIGWSERYGVDWGLSTDGGATVGDARPLTGTADPQEIAAAVDRLMLTGRPDARLVRHMIPFAAPAAPCRCETVQPCGGIIPTPDCAAHAGAARAWWHWEGPACALP
ncbi:hypothetical protein ABZX64_33270 [Streptomyces misionensis]|uniref:hypothetical protein n=1 Tax=Streptomyces misionensis TaxID=67331 RepID=UPI0033AF68C3